LHLSAIKQRKLTKNAVQNQGAEERGAFGFCNALKRGFPNVFNERVTLSVLYIPFRDVTT